MRDLGLQWAIDAVGGVSELARRVGISQPSVSNWDRVPAERVVSVEAATGVDRATLRPDLYGAAGMAGDVDEIDSARAQEYALLAALLVGAPSADMLQRAQEYALLAALLVGAPSADMLQRLAALRGDTTPLGAVHIALAESASRTTAEHVEREYFDLFIGLGRGELLPYGSYYLTGFLHERPLARLREDLGKLGIERAEGNAEPEDHAAILCEIMAGLTGGRFLAPAGADREMFEKHLDPWIGRFFADLERAEAADFYRTVGTIGRMFIDIEREALALPS
ncbi:MAG: molecular chaperone [Rhizobiales bacterium]|nr:molecular chaperone [Hyphomicrobiales bacterium]